LDTLAKKIRKQDQRRKRIREEIQKIEQEQQRVNASFSPMAGYILMGIACLSALAFDFFITTTTIGWLGEMISPDPSWHVYVIMLLAFVIMLVDATIATLASGRTAIAAVQARLHQKVWKSVLWGLAVLKIVVYIAYVYFNESSRQVAPSANFYALTVLEILLRSALLGMIYYVLDHGGAGLLFLLQESKVLIKRLMIGPQHHADNKLIGLCMEFLSESHHMQLVDGICENESYKDICALSKEVLINSEKTADNLSSEPNQQQQTLRGNSHAPSLESLVVPSFRLPSVRRAIKRIVRVQQEKMYSLNAQQKIQTVQQELSDYFPSTSQYALYAIIVGCALVLDYVMSHKLFEWLSDIAQISPAWFTFIVVLLDAAVAGVASGEFIRDKIERYDIVERWKKALWGIALIKIVQLVINYLPERVYTVLNVLEIQGIWRMYRSIDSPETMSAAQIIESAVQIGLIVLVYVVLRRAGGGVVWLVSSMRKWLLSLMYPSPARFDGKLQQHCADLRALLRRVGNNHVNEYEVICRVYGFQCKHQYEQQVVGA